MELRLRTKDLIFKNAKSAECLTEIYKVINKVYREVGYILDTEKDIFPDKYSEYSNVFFALNKKTNKIEAGIRSVKDVIGLPLEDVFDISCFKKEIVSRGGTYEEGGTRITDPRPNPNASFGTMAIWYKYLIKKNISDTFIAIHEHDRKFYERLGFIVIEKKYYNKVHSMSYLMHAETKKWLNPFKDAFLQECDNIILDL